jgi:probable rRNA maturation factor
MKLLKLVAFLRLAMQEKSKLTLTVQYADPRLTTQVPRAAIRRWIQAALFFDAELTVRFVTEKEGRTLNRSYRDKDYATNVLTFNYHESEEQATHADIVLCSDVLMRESEEQKISLEQHAAHLIVHGVLHAQGYDHEDEADAVEMEALETEILLGLGFPDPYSIS